MSDSQISGVKNTVVLGYVDVSAAGCRSVLSAAASEHFDVEPLHLRSLSRDERTHTASIADSELVIQLPNAQIYTHKQLNISMLAINTLIPNDICHSVANEILDIIINNKNVKEFIVLSSFPCYEIERSNSSCLRMIDKGVVNTAYLDLKVGDPFLNSLIQFSMVERLPITVLAVDGRKIREGTTPNKVDGSEQCIFTLIEAMNKELNVELRNEAILKWAYSGASYLDKTQNLMFV